MDRKIFEALPACCIVLEAKPGFPIRYATEAYLRITEKGLEIIGTPVFDVFSENPDDPDGTGVQNLRTSFNRVLQTGAVDVMNIQRYDTRSHASASFETRYWKPMNIPVVEEGRVKYIIHCVEDVTRQTVLRHRLKVREENTQQQIANAITTTQELERMEIGRELHDNINQLLITARLCLGRAIGKTPIDLALSEAAYGFIDKAIEEIKGISEALLTTSLQEEDLLTSLDVLISQVVAYGSINVKKEVRLPDDVLIIPKVKVAIYRIVQEQLSNIIKHAEAENLYINLSFHKGLLTLTIKDDGKGFELTEKTGGMGFQNMKSRIAVIDGTLTITSRPGDGCTIHVNIPCAV